MKNPFARQGFDSMLGANCTISSDGLIIASNSTLVIDGTFSGGSISQSTQDADKSTLVIGGSVTADKVNVSNVTITGKLKCDLLIVEGVLAVHAAGSLIAREIRYRDLAVQNGAVILAQVAHLDHVSVGEQT